MLESSEPTRQDIFDVGQMLNLATTRKTVVYADKSTHCLIQICTLGAPGIVGGCKWYAWQDLNLRPPV